MIAPNTQDTSPHGTKSNSESEIPIVRNETVKKELGESMHWNALRVDGEPKSTRWPTC